MKRPLVALGLVTAIASAGCKKKAAPAVESEGGAVSSSEAGAARPRVVADGGVRFGLADPPPPKDPPSSSSAKKEPLAPLPLASDALEVVAIGKSYNSRILWAQA